MPYKDPQRKKDWEWQHRSRRLARRRELRRLEAARKEAQHEGLGGGRQEPQHEGGGLGEASFLLPLVAGGALAAYKPKLAMGTGGLTLAIAAIYKKGWSWWIVGVLILVLGVFFYWSDQSTEKRS